MDSYQPLFIVSSLAISVYLRCCLLCHAEIKSSESQGRWWKPGVTYVEVVYVWVKDFIVIWLYELFFSQLFYPIEQVKSNIYFLFSAFSFHANTTKKNSLFFVFSHIVLFIVVPFFLLHTNQVLMWHLWTLENCRVCLSSKRSYQACHLKFWKCLFVYKSFLVNVELLLSKEQFGVKKWSIAVVPLAELCGLKLIDVVYCNYFS